MKKIAKKIIINNSFFQFDESNNKNENVILWTDIIKIMIETNDKGPLENDIYFILATTKDEIYIPSELDGCEDLLKFLQDFFPEFDDNIFIQAMSSVDNRIFEVWQKKGEEA